MAINPEKVRAARVSKGLSQQQLADAVGTSQATIDKIERGESLTSRTLPKIATVLAVDIADLDDSFSPGAVILSKPRAVIVPGNELVGEKDFPVYAAVEGGNGTMILSAEAIDYVRRPEPLKMVRNGYGVLVINTSMIPAYEPGDMALVNPVLPPLPDTDVILYSDNENGEVHGAIKRLLKYNRENWFLRQWNPPEGENMDFQWDRLVWQTSHRVVGKYARR